MTVKYLLPCTCGQEVPVTTTQAGADVPCPCGRTLAVPTLLGIRQLKQVREERPGKQDGGWTPLKGGVFVAGALVTLASLGSAGYLVWERSKLNTERPRLATKEQYIAVTRKLDVDGLWRLWDTLSDPEVWPRRRSRVFQYIVDRETDRILKNYLFVASGVALFGMAVCCSSFFVRGPSNGEPRRRKKKPPSKRGAGT